MTKAPITLSEARDLHDEWMIEMKKAPLNTRYLVRGAYNTFARWMEEQYDREAMTTDWTAENLEMYFRKYVSQFTAWDGKRAQTILVEKWLMRQGYLPWGPPIVESCIPKRGRTTPPRDRRLSDAEFLLLLKAADARHPRNYYMFVFARLTGLRVGAICDLKWADVLWEEGDILWQNPKGAPGKKLNQRTPLTPELRVVLEEWRNAYANEVRAIRVRSDWYIFPASYAKGPGRKGVSRPLGISPAQRIAKPNNIMVEALKASGLWVRDGDSWHILRKTAVNRTKQAASDDGRADAWEMAAAMAGHSTTQTTKVYTNADEDYDRYKAWASSARQLSPEAMSAIPALAGLARDAKKAPASEQADAQETDEVYSSDNVVHITSRRRRAALG